MKQITSIQKTETTMKENQEPRPRSRMNESFFVRRPAALDTQHAGSAMSAYNLQPVTVRREPAILNHTMFFMKRFLRRGGMFVTAFLFANLFLVNNVSGQSQSFTNPANNGTAANQFTVPAGVTSLNITATGGGGAGGWPSNSNPRNGGGGGALVVGTLAVTPGQVYDIVVGTGGIATNSGNNGGSGTASTVRLHLPNTLVFSASFGTGGANSGGTSGIGGSTGVGGIVTPGSNGGARSGSTGGVGGNSGAGSGGAPANTSAASNSGGGGGGGNTNGAGGNGGSGIVTITWTVPCPTINASATKNDVQCFNTSTGQIIVSASGGTAPYTFSIDNGQTYQASNTFNGLPIGTYKIRVKDANGCESKSVQ